MRTLGEIDQDLEILRQRLLDQVRGTDKWKTTWLYIDRLLDERLEHAHYTARHIREE